MSLWLHSSLIWFTDQLGCWKAFDDAEGEMQNLNDREGGSSTSQENKRRQTPWWASSLTSNDKKLVKWINFLPHKPWKQWENIQSELSIDFLKNFSSVQMRIFMWVYAILIVWLGRCRLSSRDQPKVYSGQKFQLEAACEWPAYVGWNQSDSFVVSTSMCANYYIGKSSFLLPQRPLLTLGL